jgi:CBS domain-containing protein
MQVREIMTGDVECARQDTTIAQAAKRMRELNVGSLPVCGENDRLVGMITDRDITVRCTAQSGDPGTTLVSDVMTPNVVYCFEDQQVAEVAQLMEENQVRRLPVLSADKRLVGIVSLGDLAVKCGDDALSGEALEQVSEPARPRR